MAQKIISWILVGAVTYLWWWIGYDWAYLQAPETSWSSVYLLFTLISLVLLHRNRSSA